MGLRVSDLGCQRAGRAVLRGVDFALAPGEALILRGPNGAGKSTLLRVLAGLLAPSSGEIVLGGASARTAPDEYGEQLAYCGHLDAIKPQLTVLENLRFWASLYAGAGTGAAIDVFGLDAILDRPAHMCSAGQKRRLGLARLLVARRALWLLDEPTVSLDASAVARFAATVRTHCAEGGMALIATHVPLDLGQSASLDLAPLRETRGSDADPFLSGHWT